MHSFGYFFIEAICLVIFWDKAINKDVSIKSRISPAISESKLDFCSVVRQHRPYWGKEQSG
jgi:hypothetical protein